MRALIVDDSMFIREHLQEMLKGMNVQCDHAGDGQEALDVLSRESAFDVMLCDVHMPVMDGLECVKAVRESGLYGGMRVMMVTTEIDHGVIERALEYGADEFLMKPFTEEGIREKLLLLGMSVV